MYQLDFNAAMQIIMTLMIGALGWFIQRSIRKFDEGLAKLDARINAVEAKNDKLREEFQAFLRDMPMVYTLREDFLRIMNSVDEKLNRILYGKNGGNGNE